MLATAAQRSPVQERHLWSVIGAVALVRVRPSGHSERMPDIVLS
jgi:hypothetical protein